MTSIRDLERASIRDFLSGQDLSGRVLDYGCGKQPYRDLVTGEYNAWDSPRLPGSVVTAEHVPNEIVLPSPMELRMRPARNAGGFDAIICTQVIQYVTDPFVLLQRLRLLLAKDGVLLLTGPTNWPMVELEDLWRFTLSGVAQLLEVAELEPVDLYERASVDFGGERWPLGWAAVAKKART